MVRGGDCEDDIPLFSNFFQDYKKTGLMMATRAGQGWAWKKASPVRPQHSLPGSSDPLF